MTANEFVQKWRHVPANDKSTFQSHCSGLCDLVKHGHRGAEDLRREWFAFEPNIKKLGGGQGYADVWKKRGFDIEYKGAARRPPARPLAMHPGVRTDVLQ